MPVTTSAVPLLVSADPAVVARVERAAAAAQVRPEMVSEAPAVGVWLRASVVLIDAAVLPAVAAADLPRRSGVVVVAAAGALPDELWRAALSVGAEKVAAGDGADRMLVQVLGARLDAGAAAADAGGPLVAVVSACGGAGGSVFATALAMTAARERQSAVLCDLDASGPGLELTVGAEGLSGARWSDIDAKDGRIPAESLLRALPSIRCGRGLMSLLGFGVDRDESWWQSHEIVAADAVFESTRRAGVLTVADVPRPAMPMAEPALARADWVVLVAPADVRGAIGASRWAPLLAATGGRVGLVVRGPSPGGIGAADLAAVTDLPVLAAMAPQPGVPRSIDAGDGLGRPGRGPLWRAAQRVLATVGDQQ